MTKIKMTLMGLLVMMTLVVTPVFGAEGEQGAMGEQEQQQQGHIRGSELMDKEVHDQQGNELGSVNDLVISREGEIEFLVVSEGDGLLGLGEDELTPIPFDKVDLDAFTEEDDAIVVQIDQQQFTEAPSFSDDQWETFTQGEMDQEVRGYYGEEEGVRERMEHERDEWEDDDDDDDMQMEQPGQQQQQQY